MVPGVHRVTSEAARRADRRRSIRLYLYSAAAAAVATLILFVL